MFSVEEPRAHEKVRYQFLACPGRELRIQSLDELDERMTGSQKGLQGTEALTPFYIRTGGTASTDGWISAYPDEVSGGAGRPSSNSLSSIFLLNCISSHVYSACFVPFSKTVIWNGTFMPLTFR